VSKSLKQYKKAGLNKWTRKQLAEQKILKRGKFTKHKADKMSKDAGVPLYYMHERNDIRNDKRRFQDD
jgi:hypothetical protein